MKLSTLAKTIEEELAVTMRHADWLENHSNAIYSEEAIKFAGEALSSSVGGNRARRLAFRGSDTGSCDRKRIFKYLKIPYEQRVSEKQANIFHTGNFLHLKWQMAGITEGWLKAAEVPMSAPELLLEGTADGILYDDTGFEFKSINSRGYSQVLAYGPKEEHIYQMHAYMLMGDLEKYSAIYEDKNTQEWREFRVYRNDSIIKEITDTLLGLAESISNEVLPPVLPKCINKEGMAYNYCDFKDVCFTYEGWPK
jgi:hypothetical protein